MKSVLEGISRVDGRWGGICRDNFQPRVLEGMESRIHRERPALERREGWKDEVGSGSNALHERRLVKALATLVGCSQLFSFNKVGLVLYGGEPSYG